MKEKRASQPGALYFFVFIYSIVSLKAHSKEHNPILARKSQKIRGSLKTRGSNSILQIRYRLTDQIRKYFSIKSAASIYIPIVIFSLLPAAKLMST